jgi:hypothetical protein
MDQIQYSQLLHQQVVVEEVVKVMVETEVLQVVEDTLTLLKAQEIPHQQAHLKEKAEAVVIQFQVVEVVEQLIQAEEEIQEQVHHIQVEDQEVTEQEQLLTLL